MRIIDFGLSITFADLQNPELPNEKKGTDSYMAPEVHKYFSKQDGKKIIQDGKKIDIFSLGVILFVLYFQQYPFEKKATPNDKFYKHLNSGNEQKFWER